MELEIIPKQENISAFDPDVVAVKYIEYYSFGDKYQEDEITPAVIEKILSEIPEGVNVYFFLDPYGEADWLEVVSDGTWLSLGYCFEKEDGFDCAYSYNPEFADTAELLETASFSDETLYTPMESGGQSPIPKIQAIQDMQAGVKAVEYFIHTGKLYPGIAWLKE